MLHEINLNSEREEEEYLFEIQAGETLQRSISSTRPFTLFLKKELEVKIATE